MPGLDVYTKMNYVIQVNTNERNKINIQGLSNIVFALMQEVVDLSAELEEVRKTADSCKKTIEGLAVHVNNLPQEGDKQGII